MKDGIQPDGAIADVSGRAARESMMLMATVRPEARPAAEPVSLRVRNLSAGGLMADGGTGFARDERVVLELRGLGTVGGKVAWVAAGRLGIAFDRPLDPRAARKPIAAAQPRVLVSASGRRPGFRAV